MGCGKENEKPTLGRPALRALSAEGGTLPKTRAARCAAWVFGKLSASPQRGDGVRAAEPAAPAVGAAAQPDSAEVKPLCP